MIWAIFAIACIGLVFSRWIFKTWHNPYTVFNLLWACVGALLIKGNEYVYTPSNTAIVCVIIGEIAFNLAMFSPRLAVGNRKLSIFASNEYFFDSRRAYVISVIVLILSLVSAVSAIIAILSGVSFSDVRMDYYSVSSSESVLMYYFRNYIISPLRYVVIISAIISFFGKKEKSKRLLVNCIIIIILQAITSGGRYVLINSIFMFICGYFLFAIKEKMQFKQKIGLVLAILVFSYLIIYLTNDRSSLLTQNMTVWQRLYTVIYEYFAGSVTYLGAVIENSPQIVGTTYGVNFLAGWISPIFVVLNFVGVISYPKIFSIIGTYACEILRIGPSTYYNAMPTIFGYFYIDGGLALTFIEAWLFGYVCKRLYIRSSEGNLLFSAFYILAFVQICNASTRWFIYSSDYCLAFIYLFVVIIRGGCSSDQ